LIAKSLSIISSATKKTVSESEATSFLKIKYPAVLLFFLIAALLPYLILSFYIHPIADDFDAALKGGTNYWQNQLRYFMEWNGRYSANLFVFFTSLFVKNIFLYRLYPIVLIGLLILATYLLVKNVFQKFRVIERSIISLAFVLLFLNILPAQAEGLYWFTGSITYVFPLALVLVYFTLVIQYFRNEFVLSKLIHKAGLFILLIFLCSFNETLTFTLLALHGLLSTFCFEAKAGKKNFTLGLLLIAIAGMFLMAAAPGNDVRSLNFPERHMFLHSALYSSLQSLRFAITWIASPAILAFTLLYLPFARQFPILTPRIHPLVSTSILFFIIFCAAFPAYWSMGILGQHRTINSGLFFFLLFWFFNLHIVAKLIPDSFFEYYSNRVFRNAMIIIMTITFFSTRTGSTSWRDLLNGKANQYDKELTSREMLLAQCKQNGTEECETPALTVKPKSIFVLDITNNSSHFINVDYAIYYGLNSVTIQK
jgi:hypothetical protein